VKILFTIDSLDFGGKERQFALLISNIVINYNITAELIIVNNFTAFKELAELAGKVHILKKKSKNYYSYFETIISIINNFQPDIIHCWDSFSLFLIMPISKLKGIKLVNGVIRHSHQYSPLTIDWFISKLFFFSNVTVANSYAGLKSHNLNLSFKNRVIYNGYDLSKADCSLSVEDIKKLYQIYTPYVVVMVANFIEAKDYYTFITAAQLILDKKMPVTFLCVGKGKELERIRLLVRKEHSDSIRFITDLNQPEELIKISDVCVLSSNTENHSEGLPNVIIEYMAQSKSVVATDIGGIKEILDDGVNGFLVKGKDYNSLAEKIEILLNDISLSIKIGKKGRELIEKQFTHDRMVKNYFDLYKELLGQPK
jgi:glycosyltransferase involved in cell wall biosynthesis